MACGLGRLRSRTANLLHTRGYTIVNHSKRVSLPLNKHKLQRGDSGRIITSPALPHPPATLHTSRIVYSALRPTALTRPIYLFVSAPRREDRVVLRPLDTGHHRRLDASPRLRIAYLSPELVKLLMEYRIMKSVKLLMEHRMMNA